MARVHPYAWMLTLCVVSFAFAQKIDRLSRAIEGWTKAINADRVLPETLPPKPNNKNARLVWVIDPKGNP